MPRRTPPVLLAVALGLSACTTPRSHAPAPASSTPAAQGATAEAPPPPPLVCRTERPTGSNIPRRVCYSQETLDEVSRAAQDAHRRAIGSQSQPRRE